MLRHYLSFLCIFVSRQLELHRIRHFYVQRNILDRCLSQILPADRHYLVAAQNFTRFRSTASRDLLRNENDTQKRFSDQ